MVRVITFAKETKETGELNAALWKKQAPGHIEEQPEPKRAPFTDHKTFTWERVIYTVFVPGKVGIAPRTVTRANMTRNGATNTCMTKVEDEEAGCSGRREDPASSVDRILRLGPQK